MTDKHKKVRVEFKKNRAKPPRGNDLTRSYRPDDDAAHDHATGERVRAKGDLSRKRTVTLPDDDEKETVPGRVLRLYGLYSDVELDDGSVVRCTVRRVLKTVATDERAVVTTGDRVRVRRETPDAVIVHVEPRHGVLTRASRKREHVLVANVDQLVIVMALAQPELKPHLLDRYVAAAYQGELHPVICLNKADLVDPVEFVPLVGAFAQMGVPAILTSATTGRGIDPLRERLAGRTSVFSGQSGVGKSSLLNAIQPGLDRHVRDVSDVTQKGTHTTVTAELIRLDLPGGGWVVDTPGVRQFQLSSIRPEEVEGLFPDFRPFVPLCGFPDCTHTHEAKCAVKRAVQKKWIAIRRYESYVGLFRGIAAEG
jgi:ribosome biogenesis GTPase